MGFHRKSDRDVRKKKYTSQFARTEANKKRNITKMMADNPNYPAKKGNK